MAEALADKALLKNWAELKFRGIFEVEERKTVFISGCSRGIGKTTAELFAQRGWNVIAHARQYTKEFEEFVCHLADENGVTVMPVYFDMKDEVAMKEQIQTVISKRKISVNALVNNAGICEIKLFLMTSLSAIRETFDINLFSHMRLTQLLLKRMPEGSSIVNVASIDGLKPQRGETAYAASKAAMLAWTEVLRLELLGRIRVNAVAPQAVSTDLAYSIKKQTEWKESTLIEPCDIAKSIYFLSSEEASEITGEVLKITGKLI